VVVFCGIDSGSCGFDGGGGGSHGGCFIAGDGRG